MPPVYRGRGFITSQGFITRLLTMDELPFMPYNTSLKDYGRENRIQHKMTKAEWLMRNLVLKENKTWYRFLRQKIIKSFILDFYCSQLRLGIEIDGNSHNGKQEYDDIRTDILSEHGIKIIRYTNNDIEKNIYWVVLDLREQIKERILFLRQN